MYPKKPGGLRFHGTRYALSILAFSSILTEARWPRIYLSRSRDANRWYITIHDLKVRCLRTAVQEAKKSGDGRRRQRRTRERFEEDINRGMKDAGGTFASKRGGSSKQWQSHSPIEHRDVLRQTEYTMKNMNTK
jgi:hypothetical protein